MEGFIPQLFVIKGDSESKKAKSFLTKSRVAFREVDLVKSGALAFIERDFGVKRLPFLVTNQSKYEGLAQIKRFALNSQ